MNKPQENQTRGRSPVKNKKINGRHGRRQLIDRKTGCLLPNQRVRFRTNP